MKNNLAKLAPCLALALISLSVSALAAAQPESVFIVRDGKWVLPSGGEATGTNGSSPEQGMFWYAVDPEFDEAAQGLPPGILLYNTADAQYSFLPAEEGQEYIEQVHFSPDLKRMVVGRLVPRYASVLEVYDLTALKLEKDFWADVAVWFVDDVRFAFTLFDHSPHRPQQWGMWWAASAALYDPESETGYVLVKGATATESFYVKGVEANEITLIVTSVKEKEDWVDVDKQEDSEITIEVPAAD